MKTLEAPWLMEDGPQAIFDLLRPVPTYVVGGCVRNTLLNMPVKDVDFATAAHPETVIEMADKAGLRVIPTGLEHGTVTVLADDQPFEITTFRRDVATDGRRATVAFAETLEEDAIRRDFTVNAIYADSQGTLFDPTGGIPDIGARRIRFIQDASQRIREDYLRSLRFFRFCAWYADPSEGMDADALDAISRNLDGLETLSRERVGSELLRLLEAPDPSPAVAVMRTTGVLSRILPGADDTSLAPLVEFERILGVQPSALRRMAVLGGAYETLRLSRASLANIENMREGASLGSGEAGYTYGIETGRDALLVAAASTGHPVTPLALEELRKGADAEFPIKAADLMDTYQGKALGDRLRELEGQWIESGFTLSRDVLLAQG